MKKADVTAEMVALEYSKGCNFNSQINLYETVEANENFYIGE